MATKQNSGGYRSGINSRDSPTLSEYMSEQPSGRLLPAAISLMGTLVKVQTKQNEFYEGVFQAFSPTFEIALEVVHLLEAGREDELPRKGTVHDKMVFKFEDVVKIEGSQDLDSVLNNKSGFATDSEISRANNGSMEPMRELEPWEPDVGGDDDHLPPENNVPLGDGWSAEAMFDMNQKRFLVKSDYDEKLYHTADVNLDPNSEAYQEQARRADEIAREIERNPASRRAAELENDDEERDIIERGSANSSTATTPTSTTGPGALNKYVPPNKRTGGGAGDRGGRGGRRGGGPGGVGPFQPTMRNPGGGDIRSRGRDNADPSGGYQLNAGGYYNQRPNRFAHQHHQMLPQTSHERSPSGPNGPANEWERVRGPKRQDVRESYGGPSSTVAAPPATTTAQANRPIAMIPTRPNTDVPPSNGRGKMDELRKFSKNFQLVPPEQFGGIPGSSQSGPVSAPPAASATNQAPRLQPQSSPTQTQIPLTSTMPPPQGNQRPSPELKNQLSGGYGMGGHQTGPPPMHHQHTTKIPQASPVQNQPAPMPQSIRNEVPPRMLTMNEQFTHQQTTQSAPHPQQHPTTDYSNPPPMHQQPRPGHPPMFVQNTQTGNGGISHAPKMQTIPAHVTQLQPVVMNQPIPPPMSQPQAPPPTLQQQQQMQQADHEQRTNEQTNEAVKKSKLNPEAAEFRPQFLRQGSVSTGTTATMMPVVPNQAIGNYPVPVQSPPTAPLIAQAPVPPMLVYGGVPAGAQVTNQAVYIGAANAAYQQQQQPQSSAVSVQFVPGNTPMYTIQANQPAAMAIIPNSTYRPRAAISGPPQPAVAAATGQPIVASPYATTGQYVFYNAAGVHQTNQPTAPGATYQPNAYVVNPNRMYAPQYVVPQAVASSENCQQQFCTTMSPIVQMAPTAYPQAASVPPSMHQVSQYTHQQGNGNNHPQTPPTTSQQQPSQSTNQTPASGLSIPSATAAGGTVSVNAPMMAYPSSAPTPQSPQYAAAPAGLYQQGAMQYFMVPNGNYAVATAAAPQLYSSQGGFAAGAVQIQNPANVHPVYQTGAQQHFVAQEFAHPHYAAMAAAQQAAFATAQHQMSHVSGYHPAVLRSASVPSFPHGAVPVAGGASGQGATIPQQNNHA